MYRCGAGRSAFFVDALGQASHCVLDRQPAFPILEMEWTEIWSRIGDWVTQPLPKDAPCADCGLRAGCENCPARARAATGDPFGHDPYHCDVTHAEYGYEPGVHVPRTAPAPRPAGACAR
jgi:radical SAM protein with 4Fe4S-binding SPASM domain